MMLITVDILKKLCPDNKKGNLQQVADAINKVCPMYGINNADILHEFLANLLEECGEFTVFSESLNYSTDALINKFGRHRITIEQANNFGRNENHPANQIAIANTLYGGKWGLQNLGNTQPNDGWELRGSGPIQITGRANITRFAIYMRKRFNIQKTIQQWAGLLRTHIEYGIHSACWIFAVSNELIDEAINDDMRTIVKRINGGFINYPKRLHYYENCKKLIK